MRYSIEYWFQDHKTGDKVIVKEPIFKFILKLIRHIPHPQFKTVRYYGIYAACDHKHKKAVRLKLSHQNKNRHDRPKHYRLSLIDTFGVDPLEYKADWYGRTIIFVNRFFPSSQMCSDCACINTITKDLTVREWDCPACGAHHDRDINSAINIKKELLRLLYA